MNRTLLVLLALPFALLGTSQALAQSSLSGQGKALTGAGSFALIVNVNESNRAASGTFRYERETNRGVMELVVDGVADCLWISQDGSRAVVAGAATVASNPAGLATSEWFFAAVQDNGSADRVRSGFISRTDGLAKCQSGETAFPALVASGNFTIRQGTQGADVSGTDTDVVSADTENLTAPAFDGALYIPFDGTASPGQIVTKPGATPPTFVPGKYGQAIFLTDSSAVAVPLELNPIETPQITMTAWIRRAPRSGIGKIIYTYGAGHPILHMYGGNPRILRASAGRNSFNMTASGSKIEPNQWTFVAGVFDYESKTMRLHVNGEVQIIDQTPGGDPLRMDLNSSDVGAQRKVAGPDGVDGFYVTIGANEFRSFGGVLKGYAIDDVRIYTRALSEQTIAGLAGGGATPATAPSRYADIPVLGDPVRDFGLPQELDKNAASSAAGADVMIEAIGNEASPLPAGYDMLPQPAGGQGTTTVDANTIGSDRLASQGLMSETVQDTPKIEGIAATGTATDVSPDVCKDQSGAEIACFTPGLSDPRVTANDPADSLTAPEGIALPQSEFGTDVYEQIASRQARESELEEFENEQTRLQNEAEMARREAAAAAASAASGTETRSQELSAADDDRRPFPVGDATYTAFSGWLFGISRRLELAGEDDFMSRISWSEKSNRPCVVGISGVSASERVEFSCTGGTFLTSVGARIVRTGTATPIAAIQVCSRKSNKRLKGIRIWGDKINSDGTTENGYASDAEESANCNEWGKIVRCPSNQIATGVVVLAENSRGRNKAAVTGLRLICHRIEMR